MRYWILIALVAGVAQAATLPATPGLLPTEVVRPLIDLDPEVAAARANREAAQQDAALAKGSPYEWSAKLSAQRRTLDAGPRYQEWNAGLERSLRLPGKAAADRKLGQAMLEEGDARYGEARHETARELLALWLDWASAEQAHVLARANLQAAQENFGIVEKRVKAGDAARLDAGVARSDYDEQQRAANDAKTAANVAWAHLHARFPGLPRQYSALPLAAPVSGDAAFWRERISSQSDELKVSEALRAKAQAHGERARAERWPDPTLGLFTASEVGGRERLTGVTLSIPIPGSLRSGRASRAVHAAEASRHEAELVKRAIDARIGATLASAQGAYDSWQSAESGAAAMGDNARLMQRAYTLGEADLHSLLMARRQATMVAHSALAAKTAAARAYYSLLIDAHLVWDMDHE